METFFYQYIFLLLDEQCADKVLFVLGPKVVSNIITVDSIKLLTSVLKRKVIIWDNIHANDYDPKRVFLGPYKG